MPSLKRIYFSLLLFALVNMIGTAGYIMLEHADPLSALYMTVISVMTVGYNEAFHLDSTGRIFTIILIMSGVGAWTFLVVSTIAFVVEGEASEYFKIRSTKKRIGRMKNHFIICGMGQTGRSVLEELLLAKAQVVVVERERRVADEVSVKYPDLPVIVGDATSDEVLENAGIMKARGLIAATESDPDNLLVVLTARSSNKSLVITTRAARTDNFNKLIMAGANHVVLPKEICGKRMAASLLRPQVVDFLDVMTRQSNESLFMEQMSVPECSPIIGRNLLELEIPRKTGMLVVAIKRKSGEYVFSPTPAQQFQEGDVVIVVGKPEKMTLLKEILAGENNRCQVPDEQ